MKLVIKMSVEYFLKDPVNMSLVNRQQTSIWTINGLVYWHIYMSFSLNVL